MHVIVLFSNIYLVHLFKSHKLFGFPESFAYLNPF